MSGFRALQLGAAMGSIAVGLLLGAAVFPKSAVAVSCDADMRGGGPSGWSVNGTFGAVEDAVLFTHGLDAVRDDAFNSPRVAGVDSDIYMNPKPDGCRRVLHGHGVNFPSAVAGGVRVRPKLYFPAGSSFARTLIVLTNPGQSLEEIQYAIDADPGSDDATRIGTTSNGNRSVETTDAWATTCEDQQGDGCAGTGGADADRDPELAHIWERQGPRRESVDVLELADGLDDYDARFIHVLIDPGETIAFMDIEMMAPTIGGANRFARRAAAHPRRSGLFDGMSHRERSELVNW